ncbi:MAG TPA: hypothetical protein VHX14_20060 [Thermoanaerobaculia bacterium]|jgi:hypothetical protein|nr:hypothetical protein [Thermoanaerobaculia bacterium]
MRWPEVLAVLVGIAGAGLGVWLLLRRPKLLLKRADLRIRDNETGWLLLSPPPDEVSEMRAAERRGALLNRFGARALTFEILEELPIGASTEFIESPPGIESSVREFVTRTGPFAQLARVSWEVQDRNLLLLERVSDLIIGIRRRHERLDDGAVVRLDSKAKDAPIVVLETDAPDIYSPDLMRFRDWLGVGVRITRSSRPRMQGRCKAGNGLDGTVGGIVQCGYDTFGLTCAHVLSKECLSAHHRCAVTNESIEPDAALLRTEMPCFTFPSVPRQCTVASVEDVNQMLRTHGNVSMRPVVHGRGEGAAYTRVSFFSTGLVDYHFPHVEIRPKREGIDRLTGGYTTTSRFSDGGDSGSWVFEKGTDNWIGLLVAGDSIERSSFVAESQPLFRYIGLVLKSRNVDLFSY